jgi:ribosomal protein L14E/L6E/L27E
MILVVVGVTDEGYLLVANGKTRKLETPKKKKQKHVLLLDLPIKAEAPDGMLTNRMLKAAVKGAEDFFGTQKE